MLKFMSGDVEGLGVRFAIRISTCDNCKLTKGLANETMAYICFDGIHMLEVIFLCMPISIFKQKLFDAMF